MYSVLQASKSLNMTRQAVYQAIDRYKMIEKGYITIVKGKKKITQDGLDFLIRKKAENDPNQKLLRKIQEELNTSQNIIKQLKNEIEIEKELKLYYKAKCEESEKINVINNQKIELLKKEVENYQEFISSNFFVRLLYKFARKKELI